MARPLGYGVGVALEPTVLLEIGAAVLVGLGAVVGTVLGVAVGDGLGGGEYVEK